MVQGKAAVMVKPDLAGFLEKAGQGNLIPICAEILADLETPVSAYLAMSRGPYNFLLESVEGGTNVGRYSFLGFEPSLIFRSKGREITVQRGLDVTRSEGDPIEALRRIMAEFRPVADESLPPFIGGAVGYLSYDMVRHIESLPDENPDDLGLPDSLFMIPEVILVFDRVTKLIKVISNARVDGDPEAAYQAAAARISRAVHVLETHTVKRPVEPFAAGTGTAVESNFTREEFMEAVERCREYILAGDTLQTVLSQRFSIPFAGDPLDLYRTLRTINPSPYMFFFDMGDAHLVGSSPETMVKVVGRKVMVKPIAGTRRRGAGSEEDKRLAAELLADEKEAAEHVMLVDLGRNDLGRICRPGSVEVTDFRSVERYSHVMHLVSSVEGELLDEHDAFSAVRASFPAGTVSGAPKIRAMEIIEELEPVKRGPYAGVVGYFSFNGNLDSCITIRTVLVHGDRAYVQAGAGIVADSDPGAEYEETRSKAMAVFAALGIEE